MTFFTEPSKQLETVPFEQAASGKRVGFFESWAVSYNEQVRASATHGIQDQMWRADNEQVRKLRELGEDNVPALSEESIGWFSDHLPGPVDKDWNYLDVAKFYEDGGAPETAAQLEEYDKRVAELNKKYPDAALRNSRQMWDDVKSEAQRYDARARTDRKTIGGHVGGFMGAMAGAFNPNTDPLNVVTAPIGGIGKNIVSRVAGQGAAQGFVESLNQVTGVQDQRRLLGLDHGFGDAAQRVAGAVIGGAALQGLGEGIAVGARKWFGNTPSDPAPEVFVPQREALPDATNVPPRAVPADEGLAASLLVTKPSSFDDHLLLQVPGARSRAGKANAASDLVYMDTQLGRWDVDTPATVAPSETGSIQAGFKGDVAPDMRAMDKSVSIESGARKVDPVVMRKYDLTRQRMEALRARIDALNEGKADEVTERLAAIDKKIYELQSQADALTGKRAAPFKKKIKKLQADKSNVVAEAGDNPEMAQVRRQLVKEDEKLRDLAPDVTRAYDHARGEWAAGEGARAAAYDMVRRGDTKPAESDAEFFAPVLRELSDDAPLLKQAGKVEGSLGPNADNIDVARAVVAENAKVQDAAIEEYRASIDRIVGMEKGEELSVDGTPYKLDLDNDKIFVPNEDGTGSRELSIRELIEENKMSELELQAVSTCSVGKTS